VQPNNNIVIKFPEFDLSGLAPLKWTQS